LRPPGRVIREPLSWLLGVIAVSIAVLGFHPYPFTLVDAGLLIGVITGFLVHEFSHKVVATRSGLKAGFVADAYGIALTVVSGALPIKILAPGYVMITGPWYMERAFKKSVAAGPASNIMVSAVALIAGLLAGSGTPWRSLLISTSSINAWFALFNLIPVPPLDGSKILRGGQRLWVGLLSAALLLYIISNRA